MKLTPLKVLLLCLASGLSSGLIIPLFPSSSSITYLLPGVFFGFFLLIRLPGMQAISRSKRALVVLTSGAACFLAINLAIQILPGKSRLDWIAFAAAGAAGAAFLHLMLLFMGVLRRSPKRLFLTLSAGALLGLVFWMDVKSESDFVGALIFGAYYAAWQAGVGWVLFYHARAAAATRLHPRA